MQISRQRAPASGRSWRPALLFAFACTRADRAPELCMRYIVRRHMAWTVASRTSRRAPTDAKL